MTCQDVLNSAFNHPSITNKAQQKEGELLILSMIKCLKGVIIGVVTHDIHWCNYTMFTERWQQATRR
jgi:hypothetical protein